MVIEHQNHFVIICKHCFYIQWLYDVDVKDFNVDVAIIDFYMGIKDSLNEYPSFETICRSMVQRTDSEDDLWIVHDHQIKMSEYLNSDLTESYAGETMANSFSLRSFIGPITFILASLNAYLQMHSPTSNAGTNCFGVGLVGSATNMGSRVDWHRNAAQFLPADRQAILPHAVNPQRSWGVLTASEANRAMDEDPTLSDGWTASEERVPITLNQRSWSVLSPLQQEVAPIKNSAEDLKQRFFSDVAETPIVLENGLTALNEWEALKAWVPS